VSWNFRVAQESFDNIPAHNLWIFPGEEPGDLEAGQVAAGVEWGSTAHLNIPGDTLAKFPRGAQGIVPV
jgi:hypothetical protein